jgi:hypothetical protein
MFRLMKLKPPHGWIAVGWELAIVTLGVLIALAAQQFAEASNERREAAATRAALIQEIEESLAVLELRTRAQPCVDRRLNELRAIVEQWGRTGTFETPRWVAQAPWFVMNNLRVDAAVSAGRLPLLSNEEQYRFGLTAGTIRNYREIQLAEMDAWAKLRMLQSGADALSESDRTVIRVALQEASLLNFRAKADTVHGLAVAASFGWHPDRRRVQALMPRSFAGGRFTPSICVSIDTPPEQANREAHLVMPLPE